MVMAAAVWTVDMLEALPEDGSRYEIIDGALYVTPSPDLAHQSVITRLIVLVHQYLEPERRARVVTSPSDVRQSERTCVQPDVYVFPRRPVTLGHTPQALHELML